MKRIHYLDNLRGFIVFLVVCLHTLLPYHFSRALEPITDEPYLIGNFLLHIIFDEHVLMSVVFYIAGYFTYLSLRQGKLRFMKRKAVRILLPMLTASYILAPVINYLSLIISGSRPSFLTHVIHFVSKEFQEIEPGLFRRFFDIITLQFPLTSGHLWFIRALLYYFSITLILYALLGKWIDRFYTYREKKDLSGRMILLIALGFITLESTARYFSFPEGKLLTAYTLGLIICLFNGQNQLMEILKKHPFIVLILFFLLGDFEILVRNAILQYNGKYLFFLLDYCRIFSNYLQLALYLLVFYLFFNRPLPVMTSYSHQSYSIYILHVYVINLLSPLFNKWKGYTFGEIGAFLTLTVILSYLVSYGWYKIRKSSILFKA